MELSEKIGSPVISWIELHPVTLFYLQSVDMYIARYGRPMS